jgi:DNA helicase HerA-like ATPase
VSPKEDFYIGRSYDLASGEIQEKKTLYDPDDLTTHGVVVGMTGSGKTGLCVDILEEAALAGIPALLVDPKGDITNLLLHFPNLAPEDFQPWIDPDEARRKDITAEAAADETAQLWRNGLNKWDISPDRIQQVTESVQYAIYSPGSTAGIPINILASLTAPDL